MHAVVNVSYSPGERANCDEEKISGWPLIVTSRRIVTRRSFVVILVLVKTDFKEKFEAYAIFTTLRGIRAFGRRLTL